MQPNCSSPALAEIAGQCSSQYSYKIISPGHTLSHLSNLCNINLELSQSIV